MGHVPFFMCFVALVIQGGAMAKFWPLHHYDQCMGENRRKNTWHSLWERGRVNPIFLPNAGWDVC